LKPINIFITEN
jgi:serine/threonine protein kinase